MRVTFSLQVKYTGDKRSVVVTTKATAPGGMRTEKVGLPFDPDLFDHMVEHGVVVQVQATSNASCQADLSHSVQYWLLCMVFLL